MPILKTALTRARMQDITAANCKIYKSTNTWGKLSNSLRANIFAFMVFKEQANRYGKTLRVGSIRGITVVVTNTVI